MKAMGTPCSSNTSGGCMVAAMCAMYLVFFSSYLSMPLNGEPKPLNAEPKPLDGEPRPSNGEPQP